MGCTLSLSWLGAQQSPPSPEKVAPGKQYSWDKVREEVDVASFTIDGLVGGEEGRLPGTIRGQQFQVKNCKNSNIFLCDWSNTVMVDDCKNCKIFIGPVKGSVFVRDCVDCVVVVACGQFRTRDCSNLTSFLCVNTQPIIESSSRVRVGCFQYNYPGIGEQLEAAEVSPWNNNWWNVHDFSPVDGLGKNWSRLGQMFKVHDFLPDPGGQTVQGLDVSSTPSQSLVPLTVGAAVDKRRLVEEESCLMVFFYQQDSQPGQQDGMARSALKMVKEQFPSTLVIRTQHLSIRPADAERLFGRWVAEVGRGPVIVIQLSGSGSLEAGRKVVTEQPRTGLIGVSGNQSQAEKDLQGLFGLAEMHLGF